MCVDVGNPHVVIFQKMVEEKKNEIGQKFQDKNLFKNGVNVSFAQV